MEANRTEVDRAPSAPLARHIVRYDSMGQPVDYREPAEVTRYGVMPRVGETLSDAMGQAYRPQTRVERHPDPGAASYPLATGAVWTEETLVENRVGTADGKVSTGCGPQVQPGLRGQGWQGTTTVAYQQ